MPRVPSKTATRRLRRRRSAPRDDRAFLLDFLWRLRSPAEIVANARGSIVHLQSGLHFVMLAVEAAGPLPPALRKRLEPWFMELDRRREEVLTSLRKADQPEGAKRETAA